MSDGNDSLVVRATADDASAETVRRSVAALVSACHNIALNAGWWTNVKTGESMSGYDADGNPKRNIGELLALVHSELSEALEGARKGLMDEHLPHRKSLEVELADAVIRIFDMAGGLCLDLPGAIVEKLAYNARRADHKIENRAADGGKKF